MITAAGLSKRFGPTLAVDGLSFEVRPGVVTGFLGPNGSGKSTTMRMIMGLDAPDRGQATINGRPFREARWPLREAGAMLDARGFQPGRSARSHLAALAASNGIARSRVEEVLGLVGLQDACRAGPASSRWVWPSGLAWRPRCSATPACWFSTSRSTGWIPRASGGSGSCSSRWPATAAPCWCPAT